MIRLTATKTLNDLTVTACVELADGAPDIPGKLRALLDQVAAVTAKPPANGQAPPAGQQPAHAAPANGNGEPDRLSQKQRNYALALASRSGIKGLAGLDKKSMEFAGKKLAELTRAEGSALIDHLREQSEKAAS